jgi:hypothetical protein
MAKNMGPEEIRAQVSSQDAKKAAQAGRCGTAFREIVTAAQMAGDSQAVKRDFYAAVRAFEKHCIAPGKLSGAPKRKTSRKSRKK